MSIRLFFLVLFTSLYSCKGQKIKLSITNRSSRTIDSILIPECYVRIVEKILKDFIKVLFIDVSNIDANKEGYLDIFFIKKGKKDIAPGANMIGEYLPVRKKIFIYLIMV